MATPSELSNRDVTERQNDLVEESENLDVAPQYPGPGKLAIIMVSLYTSIFLISLDRTIIGVAIPHITDEFHSINDIGW